MNQKKICWFCFECHLCCHPVYSGWLKEVCKLLEVNPFVEFLQGKKSHKAFPYIQQRPRIIVLLKMFVGIRWFQTLKPTDSIFEFLRQQTDLNYPLINSTRKPWLKFLPFLSKGSHLMLKRQDLWKPAEMSGTYYHYDFVCLWGLLVQGLGLGLAWQSSSDWDWDYIRDGDAGWEMGM